MINIKAGHIAYGATRSGWVCDFSFSAEDVKRRKEMDMEIYTIEMKKLAAGLVEKGIPFKFRKLFDGYQLVVRDDNGKSLWDAICHRGSYGHEVGRLEIMGNIVSPDVRDEVEGYLTAEDILARL